MNTMVIGIICGVVAGLIVAECSAFAPLLAKRIMRLSARVYYARDHAVAAERAEEWQALIDDRPGNLLKLGTAYVFGIGAIGLVAGRAARGVLRPVMSIQEHRRRSLRAASGFLGSLILFTVMMYTVGMTLPTALAVCGVVSPLVAFLWEFTIVGRKRLSYRVQMDTPFTGAHALGADILWNGKTVTEPSFVLLKVENTGWTVIAEDDYRDPESEQTGIRVTFPGRRVVGVAVTELSPPELRDFFIPRPGGAPGGTDGIGFGEEDSAGIVRLPRVELLRGFHYQVLVALERKSGNVGDAFPGPEFRAYLSRRLRRWSW